MSMQSFIWPVQSENVNSAATYSKLRIINVDDAQIIGERLVAMLDEMEAIEFCGSAMNYHDALTMVKAHNPHVVIIDLNLGDGQGLNGMDLLAALKSEYPGVVLVMLTNTSGPQYRRRCLELGADFFFDKSHDFERIPDMIRNLVPGTE